MTLTPYDLFVAISNKGYVPPVAAQITLDSMTRSTEDGTGKSVAPRFVGTGDHLKSLLEIDRRNVYQAFFGVTMPDDYLESTWLAGEEPGHGMRLERWAERLIHADVMVMQGKIETTIDYLLYFMEQEAKK